MSAEAWIGGESLPWEDDQINYNGTKPKKKRRPYYSRDKYSQKVLADLLKEIEAFDLREGQLCSFNGVRK